MSQSFELWRLGSNTILALSFEIVTKKNSLCLVDVNLLGLVEIPRIDSSECKPTRDPRGIRLGLRNCLGLRGKVELR